MKKYIVLLVLLCIFECKARLQTLTMNEALTQFSIKCGIITIPDVSSDKIQSITFRIKELLSNDTTITQQYGIYRFESNIEDTGTNIFFKKNNSFEIFDISDFSFFCRD